jgi:hypothetical protein
VVVVDDMLFLELVKDEDDWLWHNGRIGSMPEVGFDCFGKFAVEKVKDKMENIVGVRSPLHGVVDFSECRLLRRLCRILLHFSF